MFLMTRKRVAKAAPKKKAKLSEAMVPLQNAMEELVRQISLLSGSDEVTAEDLNALLTSLAAPAPDDQLSEFEAEAKFRAQEFAFAAMEAESVPLARRLAKRALRIDADCVDALVVLSDVDGRTPRERIEGLQKAVTAGERSLGEAFFRQNQGHFWLQIETRPYMRALERLGDVMTAAGMFVDAIGVYEKMLVLNPSDNQGVRDPLLGLYLAVNEVAGAGKLLEQYDEDVSACFAYGRVIERFLAGDEQGASVALREGIELNRHVALHLTGRKELPVALPEMYSLGGVEEAALCQHYLRAAWGRHPDALSWLCDRCAELARTPVLSKADLKAMKTPKARVQ
jgi:tetratricopeptide (TPR) repeat protein